MTDLNVGDEVIKNENRAIYLGNDWFLTYNRMFKSFSIYVSAYNNYEKTGRHYRIAEILAALKEPIDLGRL